MPDTSAAILVVGAIAHFLACQPLYGRRGFPTPDPALLSLVWMWVPPVVLTAIICKYDRRRKRTLVMYAIATSFAVSWATVMISPSSKSAAGALADMVFYAPRQLIGVFLIEAIARCVLRLVRVFVPRDACESCGYLLRGLTEPRCPECGTSFPACLIDETASDAVTPLIRRWSHWLMLAVLCATAIFPFAYRERARVRAVRIGREHAITQWEAGTAVWYVDMDMVDGLPPEQQDKWHELLFRHHVPTGLDVEPMRPYWEQKTWQTAYRDVIEQLLRDAGLSPPSVD